VIGPGLAGDPLQRISPVGGIIGIDPVLPLGSVATPRILVNRGIAMRDDLAPSAQDRAAQRFLWAWQFFRDFESDVVGNIANSSGVQ